MIGISNARSYLTRGTGGFDGSNDTGTIADSPTIGLNTHCSITLWVKFTSVSTSRPIVQKTISGAESFSLTTGGTAGIINFGPNASNRKNVAPALNNGVWRYVAASYNNTDLRVLSVYDNTPFADAICSSGPTSSTTPWKISVNQDASLLINIRMADLRIYNRALSVAELLENRYGRVASGLVGEYLFREQAGTTVADSSGNSNTLALANTATSFWTNELVKL